MGHFEESERHSACVIWPVLETFDLPFFSQFCHHYNDLTLMTPHHPPKVFDSVLQAALGGNVRLAQLPVSFRVNEVSIDVVRSCHPWVCIIQQHPTLIHGKDVPVAVFAFVLRQVAHLSVMHAVILLQVEALKLFAESCFIVIVFVELHKSVIDGRRYGTSDIELMLETKHGPRHVHQGDHLAVVHQRRK